MAAQACGCTLTKCWAQWLACTTAEVQFMEQMSMHRQWPSISAAGRPHC
jgi:hypothetical protein